jgi:hypothetical protein
MLVVGWASRPSRKGPRAGHPTFKSVNYLIRDPKQASGDARTPKTRCLLSREMLPFFLPSFFLLTNDVGRWTLDVGRWTLDVGRSR